MPELPDVVVYLDALDRRVRGRVLEAIRLGNAFVLRSVHPPLEEARGRRVTDLRRLGKRIVLGLQGDLFLVIHLMIAGRLHWREPGARLHRRAGMAAFDFPDGTLLLTEAGSKRRASLHLVEGESGLADHDPCGIEIQEASGGEFRAALTRERHTLKRSLTDPGLFSGIGNAYSDEILHRARLSPFKMTDSLDDDEIERLRVACVDVLGEWTELLRRKTGEKFPEKVTAFHEEMAVHGRYRKPCPACGTAVQRIVYAGNEADYCPRCQTGGRVLADRSLSHLLRDDWPRGIEELEARGLGLRRAPEPEKG